MVANTVIKTIIFGCLLLFGLGLQAGNSLQTDKQKIPDTIKHLIPVIEKWGHNPQLISAVKAQNSKHPKLSEIKKIDKAWIANPNLSEFMQSLMENPAAKALFRLENTETYFTEMFLMDNQGAIVAMTNKTTDYWQGDEDKFIKSYRKGVGATQIGEISFDESVQAFITQVSVPIWNDGQAIGTLTVGINLSFQLVTVRKEKPLIKITLSAKEKRWIENHPDIHLGFGENFEPFVITNDKQELLGIYVDLIDELNLVLDMSMQIELAPWPDIVKSAKEQKVDGLLGSSLQGANDRNQQLSLAITHFSAAAYTRANTLFKIDKWDDLVGLRIVYLEQQAISKRILRPYSESSDITPVASVNEAIKKLLEGKADVFVGSGSDNYYINKNVIAGVQLAYLDADTEAFGIAIRNDWPELVSIINKGIKTLGEEKINSFTAHWLNLPAAKQKLQLTIEEREWLNQHRSINLGFNADMEPLVIVDGDGNRSGILIEILDLLQRQLQHPLTLTLAPWPEMLKQVEQKKIDGLMDTTQFRAKSLGLATTTAVDKSAMSVFALQSNKFVIQHFHDLKGLRIAYPAGTLYEEMFAPYAASSELIPVSGAKQGLMLVVEKKVDVYAGFSLDSFFIYRHFLADLEIVYSELSAEQIGHIGIRDDWSPLVGILNKALSAIGEDGVTAIYNKWLNAPPALQKTSLSISQQHWVNQHPNIRLGLSSSLEPWLIKDDNGVFSGIIVDLTRALEQRLGLSITIVDDSWPNILDKAKRGEIDGLLGGVPSVQAELSLLSSNPYATLKLVAYGRSDSDIVLRSFEDFTNHKVVYYGLFVEKLLAPFTNKSDLQQIKNADEGFKLLLEHKADIYLGTSFDNYKIVRDQLIGVQALYIDASYKIPTSIAVRKDWHPLVDIFNKGLSDIGEGEIHGMISKWITPPTTGRKSTLTKGELDWVKTLPALNVAVPSSQPPLGYTSEDGALAGISSDYLSIIAERLGLSTKQVRLDSESDLETNPYAALISGQIDLSFMLARKFPLEEELGFSDPYLDIPLVVLTQRDKAIIQTPNELEKRTIAVLRNSAAHDFLKKDFPHFSLQVHTTMEQALLAVSKGRAYAIFGNAVAVDYLQRKLAINNLKNVLTTDYRYQPAIAVSDKFKPLIPIINKVLIEFTEQEKKLIFDKWVNHAIAKQVDWKSIITWFSLFMVVLISGVAFIIIRQHQKVRLSQEKAIIAFESSIKLKNDFLTAISHELRTPMNAIFGGLQIIQDHPLAHLESPLDSVQSGAADMMRLVSDILSYSEIQANQCRPNNANTSIHLLLQTLAEKYQDLCADKKLVLEWQVDKTVPEFIELDEEKLQTVLEKLLENAVKFTSEGSIQFEARCEEKTDSLELVLSVSDSGIGIDDEHKACIFEAFTQKESGFDRRFNGLGIGLSICQSLVQTMNGEINLNSEVGQGSCFTVNMPVVLGQMPLKSDHHLASSKLPILVVEDNKVNQQVMKKMLAKLGYQSLMSNDGQEALELLDKELVSLVLMDVQMPVMNGFTCTEKIRLREDDLKEIPIIAVTANLMDADKVLCKKSGMDDFIKKPVKLGILKNSLSHYIEPP